MSFVLAGAMVIAVPLLFYFGWRNPRLLRRNFSFGRRNPRLLRRNFSFCRRDPSIATLQFFKRPVRCPATIFEEAGAIPRLPRRDF
jgi:hypothetical protein